MKLQAGQSSQLANRWIRETKDQSWLIFVLSSMFGIYFQTVDKTHQHGARQAIMTGTRVV